MLLRVALALALALVLAPAPTLAATYLNPVIADEDTPDPGVAFDAASGRWFAATTTGDGADLYRLHSSADLGSWRDEGFLYPAAQRPKWIVSDAWAPELHLVAGRWIAVYVGRTSAGLLSVGVGWSSSASPLGPWVDSGAPLVTDSGPGAQGQIDPTLVIDDDGTPLLVFKEDGNFDGKPTPFHYARLVANGTALAPGEAAKWKATSLLDHTLPWEGALIEAPWIVRGPAGGGGAFSAWYLFYSGNGYSSLYAVGVARSDSILGPYVKHGNPILAQSAAFSNPGHCSIVPVGGGDTAMVYHVYFAGDSSARHMAVDAVLWNSTSGWPIVPGGVPSNGGFLPLPHAR